MRMQVGDIDVFYRDEGADGDRQPVVLITGLGGAGQAWGPQIELFASRGRVIVPDHRGTGQSTRTLDGQNIPQLAQDMAGLLRALDLGPVHLVGSSTGGAIAQHLAIDHRDVVASMTLAASWGQSDMWMRRWFDIRMAVLAGQPRDDYADLTQMLLYSPEYWRKDTIAKESQREAMINDSSHTDIELARMAMLADHDLLTPLAEVSVPTLVVVGELDIICPPYLSRILAQAIPGSELQVVPNCGHYLHVEMPDEFFIRVTEFQDHATS